MGLRPIAFFIFLISASVPNFGCSVAATRPVQQMHIADAALRAAREVNADAIENSNIPEIYRAAADNLFRAKREYRLKNFDRARQYAVKATMLAEKAEFEAIKAGGATPEAAASRANTLGEGAAPDPNLGYGGSIDTGPEDVGTLAAEPLSPTTPNLPPGDRPLEPDGEGQLYTDYVDAQSKPAGGAGKEDEKSGSSKLDKGE